MQPVRIGAVGLAISAVGIVAYAANPTASITEPKARIKSVDELQTKGPDAIDPTTHPGRALFAANCAGCHEGGVPKAPSSLFLGMMAPDAILTALNAGVMAQQAAHLKPAERAQIAEYITRTSLAAYKRPVAPARCTGPAMAFDESAPPPAVGWGHDNRRFVPSGVAGLAKSDIPRLKLKWAFAYPSALRARSQPATGWGAIFVGSQDGTVYAFDLGTGCIRWQQRFSAEIRTAIVADASTKRLYFGDLLGRAHAVDALTGKPLWSVKLDDHAEATITGSPTLGGGLLYVPVSSLEVTTAANPKYACCSFRGSVVALDPATGTVRWQAYTVPEPPREQGRTSVGTAILGPSGAPVWNSPSYDPVRRRVYFGSGENYSSPADQNSDAVFAVDALTGKRVWRTQLTTGDAWNVGCMVGNDNCPKEKGPDYDIAASVLIIPASGAGSILVAGQKSGNVFGLDPEDGKIAWETRVGHGGTQGGVHFGMAAEDSRVYVPVNDMADTGDGRVYDVAQRGAGLQAIDAVTGKILWRTLADDACTGRKFCDPGISAAITAIPGAVFAGHLDGRFQAYDGETGTVLWTVDTTKPVKTVTGATASGGAMSGPGAAIANGNVIVNSGYGMYAHMAGNLLMVFAPAK